ncbi:hypothetical protein AAFM71_00115 [Chromobacterium violaceum]|uniref:hypothetical protein n=1 Tax=Chromobacterium violaceum TaxID=536 RepID=UPI00385A2EBE
MPRQYHSQARFIKRKYMKSANGSGKKISAVGWRKMPQFLIRPQSGDEMHAGHRMILRALRTANSLYATAQYACCPAHLAPAAAHCGEGINETADSYSLRGCGVPGTAIRYSAGNKQPCHSLFSASAPRAPRLPPKSIDRSGNQWHHYRLLLHVVLLKSCLALLLKPSFHSRIISRWPAKIIVACLNCSPLPSAMRACIELAAPARNPLFRSLHDIRTKPMKPSQAVLAERTRFNRI